MPAVRRKKALKPARFAFKIEKGIPARKDLEERTGGGK